MRTSLFAAAVATGPSTDPYKPTTEVFSYTLTTYSASTVLRLEKTNCAAGGNCMNSSDKK